MLAKPSYITRFVLLGKLLVSKPVTWFIKLYCPLFTAFYSVYQFQEENILKRMLNFFKTIIRITDTKTRKNCNISWLIYLGIFLIRIYLWLDVLYPMYCIAMYPLVPGLKTYNCLFRPLVIILTKTQNAKKNVTDTIEGRFQRTFSLQTLAF